jgi:hypothetical protein
MSLSLWENKHTSIYLFVSTNKIFPNGQRKIHSCSINGLFTVHVWLVASGKLWSHRPLFLWRQRLAFSYNHICLLGETLQTSSHKNSVVIELSSQPYGFCKMVQLPIQQERPWTSFRKYFWSTLFHCVASFQGLHVCLTSLPVIISFGGPQSRNVHHLNINPWWSQGCNSEANFSDTRKHGEARTWFQRNLLEIN